MMPLRTLPVVGLQLLLLIHTTHAFVLLTANIDDVKKLAMKFVSESLAEKIAVFIAQAAQHMITKVSEEENRDVSEENKEFNIKQRSSELENDLLEDDGGNKDYSFTKSRQTNFRKDDQLFSHFEGSSKYAPARKKSPVQYAYAMNQDKLLKPKSKAEEAHLRPKIKKEDVEDPQKEKNPSPEKVLPNLNRGNSRYRASVNSIEDNDLAENRSNNSLGPELTFRADEHSTTEKVVREFDQYENKHYPKSELVATSGDIILTRIATEPTVDKQSK